MWLCKMMTNLLPKRLKCLVELSLECSECKLTFKSKSWASLCLLSDSSNSMRTSPCFTKSRENGRRDRLTVELTLTQTTLTLTLLVSSMPNTFLLWASATRNECMPASFSSVRLPCRSTLHPTKKISRFWNEMTWPSTRETVPCSGLARRRFWITWFSSLSWWPNC